jgi:mono/diheme cytochrome c family protein
MMFGADGAASMSVSILVALSITTAAAAQPGEGRRVFEAACAACHGDDGRGRARTTVGFEVPLPDFTDCSFTTREPDADWFAVSHGGGPMRAFDRMMPAFGTALTDEEIAAAVSHLRTFCADTSWPRGELNLPRALVTEKAYPEDEAVVSVSADVEGEGTSSYRFVFEKRLGPRNQYEVVLPFHAAKLGDSWAGGAGDLTLGFKRAVYHSLARGSIFSLAGEVILPTGDEGDGASKGVTVFEPFAAFGQILPADSFLQAQAGIELPVDTERAPREVFWRALVGKTVSQGRYMRAWSPMVELLAARELEDGARTHWDALPQMQITLSTRQHIMLNLGVQLPLNDADARPTKFLFYFLWDWFDGGLFEGW